MNYIGETDNLLRSLAKVVSPIKAVNLSSPRELRMIKCLKLLYFKVAKHNEE